MFHKPHTFRHWLWHMLFSTVACLDNLLTLLTLGMRSPRYFLDFPEYRWATRIFDHEAWHEEQRRAEKEEIRYELAVNLLGMSEEEYQEANPNELDRQIAAKVQAAAMAALQGQKEDPFKEFVDRMTAPKKPNPLDPVN